MIGQKIAEAIRREKLIVVVRGNTPEEALKTAEACIAGGVKLIEITFTVPNASDVILALCKKYENTDVFLGAGTVMDDNMASEAINNGAKFIVSPDFNCDVNSVCKRHKIMYMPGVFTPTEIATVIRAECTILKLFPGGILKPIGLKTLKGPFPYAEFMVTGGVSLDNVDEWFDAGAIAVGVGSNLTYKSKNKDFEGVEIEARRWVDKIKKEPVKPTRYEYD